MQRHIDRQTIVSGLDEILERLSLVGYNDINHEQFSKEMQRPLKSGDDAQYVLDCAMDVISDDQTHKQVFTIDHQESVKAQCCNYSETKTYWIAESYDDAQQQIEEETPDDRVPSGLCPRCMMEVIAHNNYDIVTGD
jgi:hypothetical protein